MLCAVLPQDSSSSEVKIEGKCLGTAVPSIYCSLTTEPHGKRSIWDKAKESRVSATHGHFQFTFLKIYLHVQTLVESSREKIIINRVCSASEQRGTALSQTNSHFLQKTFMCASTAGLQSNFPMDLHRIMAHINLLFKIPF